MSLASCFRVCMPQKGQGYAVASSAVASSSVGGEALLKCIYRSKSCTV